jgi:hypothetical protein
LTRSAPTHHGQTPGRKLGGARPRRRCNSPFTGSSSAGLSTKACFRLLSATSSLESGRQVEEAAQTTAGDPTGSVGETCCEGAHKGSIDTSAGLQVPCNPASSLERATGIEPATSSLGISSRWSHKMSFRIRIHHLRPGPRSPDLTPCHSFSRHLGSCHGSSTPNDDTLVGKNANSLLLSLTDDY